MKTLLRPRYYCEFCKKSGGRKDIIASHETSCTLNPDRICRCCIMAGMKQPTMAELLDAAQLDFDQFQEAYQSWDDGPITMLIKKADNLLALTDSGLGGVGSCPACVLAAIRQFTKGSYQFGFVFKDSLAAWLDEFGERDR